MKKQRRLLGERITVPKNPTLSELFPLPEGAKKLCAFAGNWSVEGILTFGGTPFRVTGTWAFSSAVAGWGILNVGHLNIEGMGAYEEVDLLASIPKRTLCTCFLSQTPLQPMITKEHGRMTRPCNLHTKDCRKAKSLEKR